MSTNLASLQSDFLLELFLGLDAVTPEGIRAQLIEGEIVVTTPPVGSHEHCLSRFTGQVVRRSGFDINVSMHKGLVLPSSGPHPDNHVIPDATIVGSRAFRGAPPWWRPGQDIRLVAEVTGQRPELDRIAKRHSYALAGIPRYLLIDREESRTTLFGEPEDGDYREALSLAFGKRVPLPAPFSFDLDTSDFL